MTQWYALFVDFVISTVKAIDSLAYKSPVVIMKSEVLIHILQIIYEKHYIQGNNVCISIKITTVSSLHWFLINGEPNHQGPILLTWFNFNYSMDM